MSRQLAIEYYNRGLQYMNDGKLDEALDILNKAIAEDPGHIDSYNLLGQVYDKSGKVKTARRCWLMALNLDPDNIVAKQHLAAIDAQTAGPRIQFKKLMWPAVVVMLVAALIITNSIQLSQKGDLKIQLAKMKAEMAAALGPTNQMVQTTQSQVPAGAKIEEEDEELQDYPVRSILESPAKQAPVPPEGTTAVKPKPKLETASQVTQAYAQALEDCRAGRYSQATKSFQQILEYPQTHELKDNAQYWLAECYYAQEYYGRALSEFQKVRENYPGTDKVFDAELKIAYVYFKMGRTEAARDKLSQLSREWPDQQYRSKISDLSQQIQQ